MMKKLNGIKKIAVRMAGSDKDVYQTLINLTPGTKKIMVEPGLTAYLLPDGTTLELYGVGAMYPDYLFSVSEVVISYKVAELDKAILELQIAGAKMLGTIANVCRSYRYCHLQVNDRTIIGIFEEK